MPKQDKEVVRFATFDHFRALAEESGKPASVGGVIAIKINIHRLSRWIFL